MNAGHDNSTGETPERPRFQFGLKALFVVNTLVAMIFAIVEVASAGKPIEQVAASPVVCIFCVSLTILMAILGDVVGREVGAILCTLLGAGMWSAMLWVVCEADPNIRPFLHLPAHAVVIVITVGAIVAPAAVRLGRRDPPDERSPTTQLLLDHKRKRGETRIGGNTAAERDRAKPPADE